MSKAGWLAPLVYGLFGVSMVLGWRALEDWFARPVITFSQSPGEMTQSAPSGGIGAVHFTVERIRTECVSVPIEMQVELVSAGGMSFFPSDRSGVLPDLSMGEIDHKVEFVVPIFPEPGLYSLRMHGEFVCTLPFGLVRRVKHVLAPIPFTIQEGGRDRG